MNDTAVMRVRQARPQQTPAASAVLRRGLCRSRSRLHVANSRVAVKVSSRQPSTAQVTTSVSPAISAAAISPVAGDTSAAPTR